MWKLIKKLFFLIDPEKAHYLSMDLLAFALKIPLVATLFKRSFFYKHESLNYEVDGLKYSNRLGLAAGFDKDGRWLDLLVHLGFGFIELGTVTPLPQPGNDKPRLFRLIKDQAIINRMGFNNSGVDALVNQLKNFKKPANLIIGGNIGKNKNTALENAKEDYVICFDKLFDYVDYFVVNVSSPNTAQLRALQEKEPLSNILSALQEINSAKVKPKPIYLKIAPDLNVESILDIIEVVRITKIQGIVATNTTISRPNELKEIELSKEIGGLSGAPLKNLSEEILQQLNKSKGTTIIAVGGIMTPDDALSRIRNGADLIQIYSGIIFNGPWLVKKILKRMSKDISA
ncbi:MAG: quinone-dependent dihydroorotate dehydrogenase [Saprospiraceae bacterium]